MMRSTMRAGLAGLCGLAATGCPSSSSDTNPPVLWLAPDRAETAVKLVETEPPPF
jgi:hypothetical protein